MTLVVIFFVGFVLAVVLGQTLKINAGLVAIVIGFILFWIFGGKNGALGSSTGFIKTFPTTLFWNYSMPVIFYAFAAANGTLNVLGRKIVYAFRHAKWALPFAIFVVAIIVAIAGAGTMNTFIIAPLAWGLCVAAGITPYIVPVALWTGSFVGAFMPWTSNGALTIGMYEQYLPGIDGFAMQVRVAGYYAVMAIVFLVVMYVLTRAWKTVSYKKFGIEVDEAPTDSMEKPESFNKHQVATLVIIFALILLLLVPAIINQFAPSKSMAWMSKNFTIPVTSVLGISLVAIFGGKTIKEVFSSDVNWNMIYLITGMGMYCGLAATLGIVDTLGNAMQGMNPAYVGPALCLIGSALSMVTSASTVQPLLFAMMPALQAATGLSLEAMVVPMMVGVGVTSFSPISTGGAASLIGAPKGIPEKLFVYQLVTAVALMIVAFLLAFTPLYSFLGAL
ncbi:MAG: hypothetical protein SOV74_04400 [Coriobacteriales bacterium]|nr:hypothetical protein [Coriobacteriales bacterium]